jgi:hypothetical protein
LEDRIIVTNTHDSEFACVSCGELRRRYGPWEGAALARGRPPKGWRKRRQRNYQYHPCDQVIECSDCQRSFPLPDELRDLREELLDALAPSAALAGVGEEGVTVGQVVKCLKAAIKRLRAPDVRRLPPAPREWLLGTADFFEGEYGLEGFRGDDPAEPFDQDAADLCAIDWWNHHQKIELHWPEILLGEGEFALETEDDWGWEPVACPKCGRDDRISVVRKGRPFGLIRDGVEVQNWALECGNCGRRHRVPVILSIDGKPPEPLNPANVEPEGCADESEG